MHHFYFFLEISLSLVMITKVLEFLTCSSVTEVIDIKLEYMPFLCSLLLRWFNRIKVDEDFMVSVKMRDVVRLGCILVNAFGMDQGE